MKVGGEGQTSSKVIKAPEGIPINLIDLIQKTKNNIYILQMQSNVLSAQTHIPLNHISRFCIS